MVFWGFSSASCVQKNGLGFGALGILFFQNFALESLYGVCDEGAIFYSDSSTLSDNNCVGVFSVCRS